mgnify:CR=1 FL=1
MKLFKSILMMSALCGLTLTSCSDDGYWDEASKGNLGNGVTYSFNTASDSYTYAYDSEAIGSEYSVIVNRSDASKAEALPLIVTASNPSVFSAEEVVNFEAGQHEATLIMTLAKELELEEKETLTLAIDPKAFGFSVPEAPKAPTAPTAPAEDATEEEKAQYDADMEVYEAALKEYEVKYAAYQETLKTYNKQMSEYKLTYTLTVEKEGMWNTLGEATFTDNFTFSKSGYGVTIQQNGADPTVFRLVKPYAETIGGAYANDNIVMYLLNPGETLAGVDVTQEGLVFFDTFGTGEAYDESSHIFALHPAQFSSLRNEAAWAYSRVTEWQENGLPGVIKLAPFFYVFVDSDGSGLGGWNYTQYDDIITIVFPGYVKKDFSVELAYNGMFVDPSEVKTIKGSAEYGSSVVSATAVVVQGKDAIVDAYSKLGTDYDYMKELDITASDFDVPMIVDAPTDYYTLAVFTFNEDGEMEDYNYVNFHYTGAEAPETWTAIAVGDYSYGAWAAMAGYVDEGLTLYQSDSDPTKYKITNWGFVDDEAGVYPEFEFTFDGTDVKVGDFENGYVHSSYGTMYVCDATDYFGAESPKDPSYYDSATQTFYFDVVYYVSAGYFGLGFETFEITGAPTAKARVAGEKNVKASDDVQTKYAPKKATLTDRKLVPFLSEEVSKKLNLKVIK